MPMHALELKQHNPMRDTMGGLVGAGTRKEGLGNLDYRSENFSLRNALLLFFLAFFFSTSPYISFQRSFPTTQPFTSHARNRKTPTAKRAKSQYAVSSPRIPALHSRAKTAQRDGEKSRYHGRISGGRVKNLGKYLPGEFSLRNALFFFSSSSCIHLKTPSLPTNQNPALSSQYDLSYALLCLRIPKTSTGMQLDR